MTTPGLTEWLQQSRLTVIEVDKDASHIRVRGEADVCTDVACAPDLLVVSDEGTSPDLSDLNPGDIIKLEKPASGPQRIVVLRRVWEEYTSPEV